MLNRRAFVVALASGAPALACAAPARAAGAAPLRIVASFTILADLARMVGGERVAVEALVGPGGDAHVFQPSPADARKTADAALVLVNGLGFDAWAERLAAAGGVAARVVVASKGVSPLKRDEGRDLDPHAWQAVANAKLYVETIRQALAKADPDAAPHYEANARAAQTALDALDADIRAAVAALPPQRRVVVTTHDAFGYFAAAYGLTFLAPKGVSSEADASPRDVARIIRQIRAEKIPAVFLENVTDPRLMRRIAEETGARIGGQLFADSLSPPDGPAPTYLAMMRHNIRELTSALAP